MPAYAELHARGELGDRVKRARALLRECQVCPRHCAVDRLAGEVGVCRTGARAVVSSYGPHFGEEGPLVGRGGSGTIFFTHCNLRCVFCQNYTISQKGEGYEVSPEELAGMMLALQGKGCHNINLVSPSHVVPQILEALEIAVSRGLTLPIVYNSGGYDSLDTLELLDGIVDIYMPDMKYSDEATARHYSGIKDYPAVNRAAVKEMHRQVGDLKLDENGVATRGLLVRHLVLPEGLAGTPQVVRFLAQEISPSTYLNVMAQYRPCHRAMEFPALSRPISRAEFLEAVRLARQAGLTRLDGVHGVFFLRLV
ncbi:MAG TPA: radical SAM protein [Dehalococcoidia bacterium]|nr:radical SAM protein [Dehalococcoidia bacterium]